MHGYGRLYLNLLACLEGMVFVDGKATTQMEIPELLANHIGGLADYDTQLVTMTVREEVASLWKIAVMTVKPLSSKRLVLLVLSA